MKLFLTIIAAASLLLISCGPDNSHARLSGHLLNLNQGEFLVYSPDGAISAVDTIYVEGGRFKYEPRCEHEGMITIVLPNKQEIPVFISPGKSFTIDGDAHNMKEMKVKGGKTNELMTSFRKSLVGKPENYVPNSEIKAFVEKNAASPVGLYLVRRYYLDSPKPDYNTASKVIAILKRGQPDNGALNVLQKEVSELMNTSAGSTLPSFSVQDIDGRTVSSASLSKGTVVFISQASWDFESISLFNRVVGLRHELGKDWKIVVISLDAARNKCRTSVRIDANEGYIVCDEMMAQSVLAKKLSVSQTCTVIVAQNGKIKERNKTGEQLLQYLRTL